MSEREGIEMDEGLRGWLDDALAGIENGDGAVQPQFAEVVARAHAIDPDVIGEEQLEEARALAPVVPLKTALVADPGPDAALGAFLDDVRADAESATQQRALAAIPTLATRTRRPPRVTMVAAAVAAVLVLGVGIAGAFSALRGEANAPVMQAEHEVVEPGPSRAAAAERGSGEQTAEVVEPPTSTPDPVEAPTPTVEDEREDEPTAPSTTRRRERGTKAHSDRADGLEDRLRALDEQAQALWKAGDLAGAEQAFREIIRIGKRGHYVQLAYGDLFNLAREWDAKRRRALWNEYLDRFPRGRHADDARGGLCRLAPEGERARCWERYLADMPDGSYRHTAVRALEKGE